MTPYTKKNTIAAMTPSQLRKKYGTAAEIARKYGYTRAGVALWFKAKKIPKRAQRFIELASGGEFKASP